jgi:hypothetical protein
MPHSAPEARRAEGNAASSQCRRAKAVIQYVGQGSGERRPLKADAGDAGDFPGRPIQNADIERFNDRVREECLNQHCFSTYVRHNSSGLVGRQFIPLDQWRYR